MQQEPHPPCTKERILEKIDISLDTVKTNLSDLSKNSAVHDEKLSRIAAEIKQLFDDTRNLSIKISNIQKEITEEMDSLEKEIDDNQSESKETIRDKLEVLKNYYISEYGKLEERVAKLESYKYFIVGAAIVFGYIVEHFNVISSILPKT